MRRPTMAGGFIAAVSAIALIAAPVAGATTYNNDAPIIINQAGAATPYPSSITVSGTAGPITDVNVGLDGFSHSLPDDVAIALVAPSGQAIRMMACVGSNTPAAGVFLTFDDAAATQLPDAGAPSTGTFKPTAYCDSTIFPAPGPALLTNPGPIGGGSATFASTFNGLSAIGTWKLFVFDRNDGVGSGSIPGGWSLDVHPDVTPLPAMTTPIVAPVTAPTLVKKCKKKRKKPTRRAGAAGCRKKTKKRR